MKTETRIHTIEQHVKIFDVGEIVVATSGRSGLERNLCYRVTKCIPPHAQSPDDETVIFVDGQRYGLTTEYVTTFEAYLKLLDGQEDSLVHDLDKLKANFERLLAGQPQVP